MKKHTPSILQPQLPFDKIPYGFCACGCGEKTNLAVHNDKRYGYLKGQPQRYVFGHGSRKPIDRTGPNPSGLCMCGCGQETAMAPQTQLSKGWVKGQPVCFVAGHNVAHHYNSLEEAFWAYCTPGKPDDCWLWQGTTHRGYGSFKWQNIKYLAHRVAYQLHYGPIPVGDNPHDTNICHTCDNPSCVNPAHLWLGTAAENNADRDKKGRQVTPKGSGHGNAKHTENEVIEIRQRSAQGESYSTLARAYGTTKANICSIVKRKSWRHIV